MKEEKEKEGKEKSPILALPRFTLHINDTFFVFFSAVEFYLFLGLVKCELRVVCFTSLIIV